MTKLGTLAKLMRSKNAGPFLLTIDVMFDEAATYQRVIDSGVLDDRAIAHLLGVERQLVKVYHYDPATTIKITVPRPVSVGDPADSDLFGGQVFGPLVDIDVPETAG